MTKQEAKKLICDYIDGSHDLVRFDFQRGVRRLDYDGRPYELDPEGFATIRVELQMVDRNRFATKDSGETGNSFVKE